MDITTAEFVCLEPLAEWISVEFEQRIYRGGDGGFIVEETRKGKFAHEGFSLLPTRDMREAATGAFHAIGEAARSWEA